MDVTPTLDGGHLTVTGSTNIIDGSIVTCEAWHPSEDSGLGDGRFEATKSAEVKNGAFVCEFDVSGWPAGSLRADVRFTPYALDQPASVPAEYGASGEKLAGDSVVRDSDGWIIDVLVDIPYAGPSSALAAWDWNWTARSNRTVPLPKRDVAIRG
jgi:hypothetical protein